MFSRTRLLERALSLQLSQVLHAGPPGSVGILPATDRTPATVQADNVDLVICHRQINVGLVICRRQIDARAPRNGTTCLVRPKRSLARMSMPSSNAAECRCCVTHLRGGTRHGATRRQAQADSVPRPMEAGMNTPIALRLHRTSDSSMVNAHRGADDSLHATTGRLPEPVREDSS